jgi:hypothetical protein
MVCSYIMLFTLNAVMLSVALLIDMSSVVMLSDLMPKKFYPIGQKVEN